MFHKKFHYYHYVAAIIAAGAGFLYGYDMSIIKVVFMMDAFRICFGLATWDGNFRDDQGTLITVLNNGASPRYRHLVDTDNNDLIEGIITAGYVFGTITGALIVSYLGDRIGRKKSIISSSVTFTLGAAILACSPPSYLFITLGRFIMGLSIGSFTVICPVYISELSPAKSRGEISYTYYMFMIVGIGFSAILNSSILYSMNINNDKKFDQSKNPSDQISNIEWRLAFLIQSLVGIVYTTITFALPKSPRWLCYNERNVEALHTMAYIYNTDIGNPELQNKLEVIQNDTIINRAIGHSNYSELFIPSIRRRTYNIIIMNCVQQWTGIVFFICYETRLFNDMVNTELESVIILPILAFLLLSGFSAFVCMSLIDRYGRKSLLLIGTLLMLVINIQNQISFPFSNQKFSISTPMYENLDNCESIPNEVFHHDAELDLDLYNNKCHKNVYYCAENSERISFDKDVSSYPKKDILTNKFEDFCTIVEKKNHKSFGMSLSKSSIMLFICIYISTWLPVPFIYKAEIFPIRIRTKGSAIGTMTNGINHLIIITLAPIIFKLWGQKIFILFVINCFIGSIFTIIACTECKGISLEKMEEKMSGKIIDF